MVRIARAQRAATAASYAPGKLPIFSMAFLTQSVLGPRMIGAQQPTTASQCAFAMARARAGPSSGGKDDEPASPESRSGAAASSDPAPGADADATGVDPSSRLPSRWIVPPHAAIQPRAKRKAAMKPAKRVQHGGWT